MAVFAEIPLIIKLAAIIVALIVLFFGNSGGIDVLADSIGVRIPRIVIIIVSVFSVIVTIVLIPSAISTLLSLFRSEKQPLYIYTPLVINPLQELTKSGFTFDEQSFARSIDSGRTDITALLLDAGFPPLKPIYNIDNPYHLTALHYALIKRAPNICALITLFKEHGVDLTASTVTDLREPVTLLDLAIGVRDVAAVTCLKTFFKDVNPYIIALRQKIDIIKSLNVPHSQDQRILKDAINDCFSRIEYLVTRPEAFMSLYSIDENKSKQMPANFCMFRNISDIKYYLSTISPDQWEAMENIIFQRILTGHDDDKTLGKNVSLSVVIDANEQILRSLESATP